jgi:hypothetical protein
MTARKTARIPLFIFIPPSYLKNKLPLILLLPWMFRWQLRHPPPTIKPILGFPAEFGKPMAWKLMWHSRHNLSGGAFSRLGKLLPWG